MCVVRICMFVFCVSVYLTACKPLMFEMHDIVSNIILFFNVLCTEYRVIYYLIYIRSILLHVPNSLENG